MVAAMRRLVPFVVACSLCAALAAVLALVLARGGVDTDLTAFVPTPGGDVPEALRDELRAGLSERVILAGIRGGGVADRIRASRALRQKLAGQPGVARVVNGPASAAPDGLDALMPYRYLLSPEVTPERFREDALRRALAERRRELAGLLGGVDRERLRADPTGELRAVLRQLRPEVTPATRNGIWVTDQEEHALLVIESRHDGTDLDAQQRLLDAVRAAFGEAAGDASLELVLTGQPVFAVQSRARIQATIARVSVIGGVLLVALLLWAYRSVTAIPLVAVPLLSALVAGAGVVVALFGSVHGMTLAFGGTLVGVAVDYAVHLFSHRRSGEPAQRAMIRIWPTIRLGALTTVAGYGAMVLSGVAGLMQLGVFAAAGLVAAALTTRWLLPAIVPEAPTRRHLPGPAWLDAAPPRAGRWLVVAAAVAGLGTVAGHGDRLWQDDPAAMNPVPRSLQEEDARLRSALGRADMRHLVLVSGAGAQQVLRRLEALEPSFRALVADGVVAGVDHPAGVLPSRATQLRRREALPAPDVLQRRLARAGQAQGFRDGAFTPFVEAVEAARSRDPLTIDDLEGTPLADLVQGQLVRAQGRWWGVARLRGVGDAQALAARLADAPVPGVMHLDLKAQAEAGLVRLRHHVLGYSLAGAVVMLALLGAGLRSLREAGAVWLPALLAAPSAAAILLAAGQRLSIFHLVSLLLVVGLSLDYALFFRRRGEDALARAQTRRALLVCGASTLGMFALLAGSDLSVLRDIGRTVTLGAALGLLFGWLVSARR
ncbi:MMPL family transporter [Aquisalimonas lutea]|uniref:MMPL family transporter n=1 Tax=Aquisalimonas lutea TaxID=1327750 RepID=UPI0025B414BC|nr:MMPL family transporter [Aquisalimonas lutea]MDN3517113.1 MMPL family transporter [Aquisalimonas lutea]